MGVSCVLIGLHVAHQPQVENYIATEDFLFYIQQRMQLPLEIFLSYFP